MALTPGTRLGSYEVTAQIGAGGMGEVYRARDTKLNRDVALKVLHDAVVGDADRLARFHREAHVLASLNHPNVAHLYGFEDSTSAGQALVMELVEGPTLADRLDAGAIPLTDALSIARQIADALEAAHEQGIVHRDLKPANVKVRADGTVKVLDFGLAKALDTNPAAAAADAANSPTFTAAGTRVGMILGTAAYMSPEQARGRTVDKRTDIWAFGAVLFEMLSGRAAFAGDTVTDILAAVVSREPDWSALPSTTPAAIRRLLARCLEKDPRRRLRDIGDARFELELDPLVTSFVLTDRARGFPWRQAMPWIVAGALAAVLAVSLMTTTARPPDGGPLRRLTIEIPSAAGPNWNDFDIAISNDGAQVAYNCRDGNTVGLCVRPLDSLTARRVVVNRDTNEWFFSPDGSWLGFVDPEGVWKVSLRGGGPQIMLRWPGASETAGGLTWTEDDFILWGSPTGIQRVAAAGGTPEPVTRIADGSGVAAHLWPSRLPDDRSALITIIHANGTGTAGLVNLSDGSVRDLGIRGQRFVFVEPGWLAFRQGPTVLAIAFDPRNSTHAGTPVPVIENVRTGPKVALDGTLIYVPTRGESTARLVWADREGRATAIQGDRLDYTHLDLEGDSRRALLNLAGGQIDLIDLQNGTRKLVARGAYPIWSPDGQRLTFAGRGGIRSTPIDDSTKSELLVAHSGFVVPTSWNRVTGDLAYYDHRDFEIWIRSPDAKTRRFLGAPGRKRSGRFSPNGKWLAFVSDETGDYQVYVTAYPGPGPTVPVSAKGGLSPIWSAGSNELFYRLGSKVMAARLLNETKLAFSAPAELFDGPYTLDLLGHQREDVSTDGRRFLMVENSDDFPIVVVQNWMVELGRIVR